MLRQVSICRFHMAILPGQPENSVSLFEVISQNRPRFSIQFQGKRSRSQQFNFYVVLKPANRSSRLQIFFKIGVLKSFAKFIGKPLYQSLSFNKVADLRPAKCLEHLLSQNTSGGCFCATLPIIQRLLDNSKAFLIGFYYWFQNSCYA